MLNTARHCQDGKRSPADIPAASEEFCGAAGALASPLHADQFHRPITAANNKSLTGIDDLAGRAGFKGKARPQNFDPLTLAAQLGFRTTPPGTVKVP